MKEPSIINQVQQKPRKDSISGLDQSRQPLNEQLQEKKLNTDDNNLLVQAQSRIKQLEQELSLQQLKTQVNTTPAKPQVK